MPDQRDEHAAGVEMRAQHSRPPTGHVFRRHGARGDVWHAKHRLPGGRQLQRRIGPAWSERGRPAPSYYSKRRRLDKAEAVLRRADEGGYANAALTPRPAGACVLAGVSRQIRWLLPVCVYVLLVCLGCLPVHFLYLDHHAQRTDGRPTETDTKRLHPNG
jgi:hypothetical protein